MANKPPTLVVEGSTSGHKRLQWATLDPATGDFMLALGGARVLEGGFADSSQYDSRRVRITVEFLDED